MEGSPQEHVQPTRLLLPFTHGVDMQAINLAIDFAAQLHACLVLLVLYPVENKDQAPRLDFMQQAQDYFEAVSHRAARRGGGVRVERYEVVAHDVASATISLAYAKGCANILLCLREGRGVLLQTHEIKAVCEQPGPAVYVMQLPARSRKLSLFALSRSFAACLSRLLGQPTKAGDSLPCSVDMSPRCRGEMKHPAWLLQDQQTVTPAERERAFPG